MFADKKKKTIINTISAPPLPTQLFPYSYLILAQEYSIISTDILPIFVFCFPILWEIILVEGEAIVFVYTVRYTSAWPSLKARSTGA